MPAAVFGISFKAKGNGKLFTNAAPDTWKKRNMKPIKKKKKSKTYVYINIYIYMYTLVHVLNKCFSTFFMSQFPACSPWQGEQGRKRYLQIINEHLGLFMSIPSNLSCEMSQSISCSSGNCCTWPSICALTPVRGSPALLAPLPAAAARGWASRASCRSSPGHGLLSTRKWENCLLSRE